MIGKETKEEALWKKSPITNSIRMERFKKEEIDVRMKMQVSDF